ncbi:hypothetical protein [Kibdelosporangium phytohabitans]|uniref:Uncharacterized protein n=1 Tax=Kibdelosporangium phytohabitans TaxID=860235 RepID=A0A0N9HWE9_9PSEU|nr:hypothetical protein [Kibdelosporangium phytohabitans]ALG06324.1 hypothetical protein AOZ06_04755 [Kibdelosporangium phytohabitans]MBE1467454.1 hypothetical protein [Kibdelosporangium phytohabitans]
MSTKLIYGRRVRVHVNLHLQRLSVVNPSTQRVIAYVDDIILTEVEFRYQPACVERVRARNVRAVCAYALGRHESTNTNPGVHGRRVRYNPFELPYFHDPVTGERVDRASRVLFVNLRAYVVD